MDPRLRAWLLDGEPRPEGIEVPPEVEAVAHDLQAIEEAGRQLPVLSAPPDLSHAVLDRIATTPQDPSLPDVVAEPVGFPTPANRGAWRIAAAIAAVAAVFLVVLLAVPGDPTGDVERMIPRGSDEGTTVGLRMVVQGTDGDLQRFDRHRAHEAGDTLLFRYDLRSEAVVHLVRVDADGAALLAVEEGRPGTADLMTDGRPLGYELEEGEETAVFALLSHSGRLEPSAVAEALAVGPDADAVCTAAAVQLGARCDAERVEVAR